MNLRTFMWKAQRRLFGHYLGKLFARQRTDRDGNIIPPEGFLRKLNQELVERGCTLPWMMTREECQNLWASMTEEERFAGNKPSDYAAKDVRIIEFLHSFWTPQVTPKDRILELGCNCGSNLNALHNLGYRDLSGMEINENAIAEMRRSFPDFAKTTSVSLGSLEELLPRASSNSVDVVFTMSLLFHIHPTSSFIFSEVVRIAGKYIVVIEGETANCSYVFIRNYRRVFQRLGCSQLKSVIITREAFPDVPRQYDGYTARLFAVSKNKGSKVSGK